MTYTQAQIDKANAVDLEKFLRAQGETLVRSGKEYRWKAHDSLTVCGNKWFRHSQSKGGFPVDFVMEFYGKTITATVNSDEKTLGAALGKLNVIQGENGLYTTVNGVTYDYNADHAYWAFYVNGEYAQVGMDDTEIVDGAVYKLAVEKAE